MVSIGGNDVGFGKVLRSALKGDLLHSEELPRARDAIADLPLQYRHLAEALEKVLAGRVGNVLLAEYPTDVFSSRPRGNRGSIGERVGPQEAAALRSLGMQLNARMRSACLEAASRAVRAADGTTSMASPGSFEDSTTTPPETVGSSNWTSPCGDRATLRAFHPNQKGHAAYARRHCRGRAPPWVPTAGLVIACIPAS